MDLNEKIAAVIVASRSLVNAQVTRIKHNGHLYCFHCCKEAVSPEAVVVHADTCPVGKLAVVLDDFDERLAASEAPAASTSEAQG